MSPTLRIERTFQAPAEAVFDAWTVRRSSSTSRSPTAPPPSASPTATSPATRPCARTSTAGAGRSTTSPACWRRYRELGADRDLERELGQAARAAAAPLAGPAAAGRRLPAGDQARRRRVHRTARRRPGGARVFDGAPRGADLERRRDPLAGRARRRGRRDRGRAGLPASGGAGRGGDLRWRPRGVGVRAE